MSGKVCDFEVHFFFSIFSWIHCLKARFLCVQLSIKIVFFFHVFLAVCCEFSSLLLNLFMMKFYILLIFFIAHQRKEVYFIMSVHFKWQCCQQREIRFYCAGSCGNSISELVVDITLLKCFIHVSSMFMRATDVCVLG